jgi:hypothetical protein
VDSNTVTISSNSDALSDITYIENSLVVSAGQAHDSLQQPTKDGNVWTITLNADRSGTSDVAQSFNTIAGGASHELASSHGSWGDSPGGLNFYFGVNLTIGAETITAYIHWPGQLGSFATQLVVRQQCPHPCELCDPTIQ